MRPAWPHRSISVLSGDGTPTTAGSSGPSAGPPRGVRTAASGRTTSPSGGWRLWSGAVTGGCWGGSRVSHQLIRRGLVRIHWARRGGRGIPCIYRCVYVCWFGFGFHHGPRGGAWGIPCIPPHVSVHRCRVGRRRCHQGRTFVGMSRLRWGVRTRLCRLPRVEESPAFRGGGPCEDGRGSEADRVVGAPPGGPAGWKRCTSSLLSTFPG